MLAALLLSASALAGKPVFTTIGSADLGGQADGPMFWRPAISIPAQVRTWRDVVTAEQVASRLPSAHKRG